MGTASFSVGSYGQSRGQSPAVMSSYVRTSGAHTTSTTASFAEDGSGDIELAVGEIISIHASEAMRVRFGGTAATASTGHYIPANETRKFEAADSGKVSIIDVA